MFPVLTRPLGSRNVILLFSFASATLYELSASDKEAVFVVAKPLVSAVLPASATVVFGFGGAMVLTRSAHDLGATLTGGDGVGVACSAAEVPSSAFAWAAISTALVR